MSTQPTGLEHQRIIPSQEEFQAMGRRRYQNPPLRTTPNGKQWAIRVRKDVLVGPNQIRRREQWVYLGSTDSVGKREAEKRRADKLKEINNVQEQIQSQVPMSTVLESYKSVIIPSLKPNSRATYTNCLRKHITPAFSAMALKDVTVLAVQRWINGLAHLSPATRKLQVTVLRSVLEAAATWGYTSQRNPCDSIRIPEDGGGTIDRDTRPLSIIECRNLIASARAHHPHLGSMVEVGIFCGLRIGEMLACQWSDYAPPRLRVERAVPQRGGPTTGPKSRKGVRSVPLGPVALQRPEGSRDSDRIFSRYNSYRTVTRHLDAAAAAVGIKFVGFGWHTLRHTFATLMQEGELKEWMGHATEEMSRQYVTESFVDLEQRQKQAAGLIFFVETVCKTSEKPQ